MRLLFVLALGLMHAKVLHAADLPFLDAVDRIVAEDPNLQNALQLEKVQQQLLNLDRKAALPTLNAGVRQSYNDPIGSPADATEQSSAQANLSVNLYRFGGDKALFDRAEAGEEKYQASVERIYLERESNAAELLLLLLSTRLDLDVLEKIKALRTKLSDVARRQFQKGLLAQQELQKIELDSQSIELQLQDAQVAFAQAQIDLQFYLRQDHLEGQWPLLKQKAQISGLLPKLKTPTASHPAWLEAQAALTYEQQTEDSTAAGTLPTLDANASVNKPFAGDKPLWGYAEYSLSLNIPLLDRGSSHSLHAAQLERSRAADWRLRAVRLQLERDYERSVQALKTQVQTVDSYESLVVTARKLYQDSVGRFERGLTSVNELSVDESRVYSAERESVRSWYALHRNWVRACQSSGLRLRNCWAS